MPMEPTSPRFDLEHRAAAFIAAGSGAGMSTSTATGAGRGSVVRKWGDWPKNRLGEVPPANK